MENGLGPFSGGPLQQSRTRGIDGVSSRGEESHESTDQALSTPARVVEPRERTLGGSKASKRACRRLTGEPGSSRRSCAVGVRKHVRRCDLATRETSVMAQSSGEPRGKPWQWVGAKAKAV